MIVIEDLNTGAVHYLSLALSAINTQLPVYLTNKVEYTFNERVYEVLAMDNTDGSVLFTCLGWYNVGDDLVEVINSNIRDTYDTIRYTCRWLLKDKEDGSHLWVNVIIDTDSYGSDSVFTVSPIGNCVTVSGIASSVVAYDTLSRFYNLDALPAQVVIKMFRRMYPRGSYNLFTYEGYTTPTIEEITDADFELITSARKVL